MRKEFKEFAVKGNAIDLAVGVIIGAAFGKYHRFARERYSDASDRLTYRRARFFQQVYCFKGGRGWDD